MSNYPDDMRNHDYDNRSPFFNEPDVYDCEFCGYTYELKHMRTESCCELCAEEIESD